ncbi:MAG: TetR/AcrR family transcriptional regulator [Turneriella sp.]|nr:TetR/AcrR family transcriptional regulator [Turneriella sp.]
MRQERRKQLTRERILNAARAVFAEKGYAATSIADIVKKSRIARGTFYLHFQTVEQVFQELLREVFLEIQRELTALPVETLDQVHFRQALKDLAHSLLAVFQKNRPTVSLLLVTLSGDPAIRVQTIWFQELLVASIRAMLERGISSRRLRQHDAELMSYLIAGGLREVLTQWLIYGRYEKNLEAKVDEMVNIYMNGVELLDNQ